MSDNNELDSFFSELSNNEPKKEASPKQQETSDVSLEDEFARLLNNFISGEDTPPPSTEAKPQSNTSSGLEDFITEEKQTQPQNLDNFVPTEAPASKENLDNFITEDSSTDLTSALSQAKVEVMPEKSEEEILLKSEEFELSRAIYNFQDGINAIADKKNLKTPVMEYDYKMLHPNYKPSVGRKIAQYLLDCWDLINKYDPENMKRLSKDATDEEFLVFAESLTDTDMQLVIISYVEILINLEICEVKYEQMKEIAIKNKIKKELYEEYMKLQERKNMFIEKLKQQNFPINVDALMNNYFKAAQKDAKGAFDALTKNPAMYTPIEFDKIKPKFFGLIKVAPEDGIKFNQKIGAFIKKLKI